MLQALYNAVISSSVDDEEDEDALKLLAELLAEEGVDPNAGDEALWSNVRLCCLWLNLFHDQHASLVAKHPQRQLRATADGWRCT